MKLYRRKRRSCPMCKPHKMGYAPRYKDKEVATIRRMEQEARQR